MDWADKIHKENPEQIFNIRTYKRTKFTESNKTVHYTDIKHIDLFSTLDNALMQFNCMIDAETPDNGRFAGNIIIHDEGADKPYRFDLEWCKKEIRAMVRDHDMSTSALLSEKRILTYPLENVIAGAMKFPKKDVILEWTYFCESTGVMNEPIVWWEYRKYQ